MEVTITKEDFDKAGDYTSIRNCPMAIALKRVLNSDSLIFAQKSFTDFKNNQKGSIEPGFWEHNYSDMKKEFKPFTTKIIWKRT